MLCMFFYSVGIDEDIIQVNNITYVKKVTECAIDIRLKYYKSIH